MATAALSFARETFDEDDPVTATSLSNRGMVLQALGQYAEAKEQFRRLDVRRRVLGPDDPLVGISLNQLGAILAATGDHAGARPYYERAVEIPLQGTPALIEPGTCPHLRHFGDAAPDYGGVRGGTDVPGTCAEDHPPRTRCKPSRDCRSTRPSPDNRRDPQPDHRSDRRDDTTAVDRTTGRCAQRDRSNVTHRGWNLREPRRVLSGVLKNSLKREFEFVYRVPLLIERGADPSRGYLRPRWRNCWHRWVSGSRR